MNSDSSRRTLSWAALVGVGAALAYLPTLRSYFLADDFGYIKLFSQPSLGRVLRPFFMDLSQGIWGRPQQEFRPLVGLSYTLDYQLWGTNPVGFHLTAILMHVATSLAVFGLARKGARLTNEGSALAGLTFALLPIHSESVSGINGSKVDIMPTMFYLFGFLGFICYRTTGLARYVFLATAGFLGSLMSKEIAVTFPLMTACYDLCFWRAGNAAGRHTLAPKRKPRAAFLLPYFPFVGVLVAYLALRWAIFPMVLSSGDWVFDVTGATKSVSAFGTQSGRLLTGFMSLHDYNARQFLLGPPALVGRILASAMFVLMLMWSVYAVRRADDKGNATLSILYFSAAWYFVACLPLLATYHSPRHLYLPAVGPSIALALLVGLTSGVVAAHAPVLRRAGSTAFLVLLFVLCRNENGHWVRAGEASRTLSRDLVAALEAAGNDSLLIVDAPRYLAFGHLGADVDFWNNVMPFAVQPPFAVRDYYPNSRLIEFPGVFCCPTEEWWEQKRAMLLSALSGAPEDFVEVRRLKWDERNDAVSRSKVTLRRRELRELTEGALGTSLENATTISHETAMNVTTILTDSTAPSR